MKMMRPPHTHQISIGFYIELEIDCNIPEPGFFFAESRRYGIVALTVL
jgi:hypothetical protein